MTPDTEIEVACAQCSFPAVSEYDEAGKLVNFYVAEGAPTTEEEAQEQGWVDHGLGLFCPTCSQDLDEAMGDSAGFERGAIHTALIRSFIPPKTEET